MDKTSSYKLLYLLNILMQNEYSKNEIIEQFNKVDVDIAKSLITHYIEQYAKYGIDIKNKINKNRENIYYVEQEFSDIEFEKEELNAISDVKKILITQKNYNYIRKTMRLFYKIAKCIKDKDIQREIIDFGYYSTLNWNLVQQLEKHCEEKNIIAIEYILPQGECMVIKIHADSLKVSDWSQRLYLHGVFVGSKHFSHLPVDRIFMVREVIAKNKTIEVNTNFVTYVVSKKTYDEVFFDEKEKIIKDDGEKLTIERQIDDEFYLIQRLLTFCPDVYYVSDEKIKNLFKEKLENLKASYDERIDR